MVQNIAERIKKFAQEYILQELRQTGVYEIAQPAEARLQQLINQIETQYPLIELVYDQLPTEAEWELMLAELALRSVPKPVPNLWQEVSFDFGDFQWNMFSFEQLSLQKLDTPFPTLRIFWQKYPEIPSKDLPALFENVPFFVWLHSSPLSKKYLQIAQQTLPKKNNLLVIPFENIKTLKKLPEKLKLEQLNCKHYAAFQSLQKFNDWVQFQAEQLLKKYELNKTLIKQEERYLQNKKQQFVQSANTLSQLKKTVDVQFNHFKEQLHYSLTSFFSQQNQSYYTFAEKELAELQALVLGEVRVKNNILKIPDEFKHNFLQALKQFFRQEFAKNTQQLHDTLNQTAQELRQICQEANKTEPAFAINYLVSYEYNNLIENLTIDKEFEAEVPKKNMLEIIMGARRYVFLVMIIMSSLVVPFIGAISNEIKIGMAVLTLLLTLLGLRDTQRTYKKEEAEKKQQALKKAKEYLKVFVKNFAQEMRKEWSNLLFKHLERELKEMLQTAENTLKNSSQTIQIQDEDQKRQLKERYNRIREQEAKIKQLNATLTLRLQKTLELSKHMQE